MSHKYSDKCTCQRSALLTSERTARQQAEQAWQPIETAPKDGTWVLLHCPESRRRHARIGHWWSGHWQFDQGYGKPTHWMPLPDPPGAERDALRTALQIQPQTDDDLSRSPSDGCASAAGSPRKPRHKRLPAMNRNEWRDISTAPRDGTTILGRCAEGTRFVTRRTQWGKTSHVPLYGWTHGSDVENIDLWEPTHWRWLPDPTRWRRGVGR